MTTETDELWTLTEVAGYLKLSYRYVQAKVVTQPGFPDAIYLTNRRAHPRWAAAEVREWALQQRERAA